MKNQRGFIQIPPLIAIVAGVLILGGGGYLGVKQYQNYQSEKIEQKRILQEKERRAQELIITQQAALENAERAITKLENKNLQSSASFGKSFAALTPIEVSKKFGKYVVKVSCETVSDGEIIAYSQGSGIIVGKNPNSGNFIVMTNRHVVPDILNSSPITLKNLREKGIYDTSKVYPCAVFHGLEPTRIHTSSYAASPSTYPALPEYLSRDLDVFFLEVGPRLSLGDIDSLAQFIMQPMLCKENDAGAMVGERVLILGYPAISGVFLTLTEGLISGYDDQSWLPIKKRFYITSAKIEHGNSGGAAFLLESGCLIGMPAFANIGEIESLSSLIDLPWLGKQYLLFDSSFYLK